MRYSSFGASQMSRTDDRSRVRGSRSSEAAVQRAIGCATMGGQSILRMPAYRMYRRRMADWQHHTRVLSSLQHGRLAPRVPFEVPVTPATACQRARVGPACRAAQARLASFPAPLLLPYSSGTLFRHTCTGTGRRARDTLQPCRFKLVKPLRGQFLSLTTPCVGDEQAGGGGCRCHASASAWHVSERQRASLPDARHHTTFGASAEMKNSATFPSKISPVNSGNSVAYEQHRQTTSQNLRPCLRAFSLFARASPAVLCIHRLIAIDVTALRMATVLSFVAPWQMCTSRYPPTSGWDITAPPLYTIR
ncbi:hypothetical protein PSPO01_00912 [Paraphaeosphaeria sporulosa]